MGDIMQKDCMNCVKSKECNYKHIIHSFCYRRIPIKEMNK